MPPNGEKRSRWLMGCKCGTRVKARPFPQIYRFFKVIGGILPVKTAMWCSRPDRGGIPRLQELWAVAMSLSSATLTGLAGRRNRGLPERKFRQVEHGR